MERSSNCSPHGLSVNSPGFLRTSTVPSQISPLTSHYTNATPNYITFSQTSNAPQVIFQDRANKISETQVKSWSNCSQMQPLIIGNINAAQILTTALNSSRRDASEIMCVPSTTDNNSLVGLCPVLIQQGTNDGWSQYSKSTGESKNTPSLIKSQEATVCIDLNSLRNINPAECTTSSNEILPYSASISSLPANLPLLSSSDTIILHQLVSDDTMKNTSQSSNLCSESNMANPKRQLSSLSLGSSFSMLSNVSDRNISLSSIPTFSLLPLQQNDLNNFGNTLLPSNSNSSMENENVSKDPQFNALKESAGIPSINLHSENGTQSVSVEVRAKSRRERSSESEPCELQIDETVDTDVPKSKRAIGDSECSERRENYLCRADTVILNEESSETKNNDSTMLTSDTVILQSTQSCEKNESRTSEGFTIDSDLQQPGTSAANMEVEVTSPLGNSTMIPTKHPTNMTLDTLQSMPSIILTESMVNGLYNPNLLCSLFSQTGGTQQPTMLTSLTNVTLDPGPSGKVAAITLDQPNNRSPPSSDIAGFKVGISNSVQNVNIKSSTCTSNTDDQSSSAKSTQTDWMFGNASVFFKPCYKPQSQWADTSSDDNGKSVMELQSSDPEGNIPPPSSTVLAQVNEDFMDGPLILEEQAIPASILSLIPSHISVLDSTANMNVTGTTCSTSAQGLPADISDIPQHLFPCTSCDQAFLTKRDLHRHTQEHRKLLKLKCELCTATFTRMGNFTRHKKIHNLQPESRNIFTCEHCHREFLQKCDLRRHLLIHTKQEPHRCDTCGKGYIRHSDLVVHMRFHKRDRAFKCSICDKSFFQTGDLSRHIRRTHNPGSQLTCGHCDRKYACESTLIRHMKVFHKDIILKTVNQRIQEKSGEESHISSQDLLFTTSEGKGQRDRNGE